MLYWVVNAYKQLPFFFIVRETMKKHPSKPPTTT